LAGLNPGTGRMHAGEVEIDGALVVRLIAAQFPQWAELAIEQVPSAGTENALYRLGDDLVVRLPRIRGATGQAALEQEWLPRLAPLLPLAVPTPLARGAPAEGYPWPWSVYRWLDGEAATLDRLTDARQAAIALGGFVAALRGVPSGGWPSPAPSSPRGRPLATRDPAVRDAIAALSCTFDAGELTAAWETALRAPPWLGPPTWLHGDLHATNLLARHGTLSAVIDFGCLGVGDPACDLMPAWIYLTAEGREAFRDAAWYDDAAWARGRGWALSVGLIALPYYETSNPVFAGIARHAIAEVLADHG
jgi:aminoglycoside phosphotransferase (APT) family kinase protein